MRVAQPDYTGSSHLQSPHKRLVNLFGRWNAQIASLKLPVELLTNLLDHPPADLPEIQLRRHVWHAYGAMSED